MAVIRHIMKDNPLPDYSTDEEPAQEESAAGGGMTAQDRESTHVGTKVNGTLKVLCGRRNVRVFMSPDLFLRNRAGEGKSLQGADVRQLQRDRAEAVRAQAQAGA